MHSPHRSFRPHASRRRPPGVLLLLTVFLALIATLAVVAPLPAHGLASSGHGVGYLSKADRVSWLGTYRMADGRLGFCLQAGKPSPVGKEYSTQLTTLVPGATPEATARLAYIARTFAGTTSNDEAAAAQLAVWTITGLAGKTQAHYAARANERAAVVLQRAKTIVAESTTKATMSASARMTLQLDDRGVGSIKADILTTAPGSSATVLPAGQYSGTAKLLNATLPGGATSGLIPNGSKVPITPDTSGPETRVRADITFTGLRTGRQVWVGYSPSGSQSLLFSAGGKATGTASATVSALSPRPFQPRVSTQTGAAQATPGSRLVDHLDVSVTPGTGLLSEWGKYRSGDTLLPIPVTVKSRLLGPFPDPIAPSDAWPADPPTVCTVSTVFTTGPGKATTPACRIPAAGHYVWVETIDPSDTPVDRGRNRVRPWRSAFGTASEMTFSPTGVAVHTQVASDDLAPGDCAVDELEVTGFDSSGTESPPEVEVESLLLGPFDEPVPDGRDLSDLDSLPITGTAVTTVTADGTYETPCIRVTDPGHYVFVFRSEGSGQDPADPQRIPPFSDLVAHSPEMLSVTEPPRPTPPPTVPPTTPPVKPTPTPSPTPPVPTVPPATPSATPPATPRPPRPLPPVLAFTGSTGTTGLVAVGGAGVALGAITLAARALVRRHRSRTTAGRIGASSSTDSDDGAGSHHR